MLGLYYLSLETAEFNAAKDNDAKAFGSVGEIEFALAAGAIKLHDKIPRADRHDRPCRREGEEDRGDHAGQDADRPVAAVERQRAVRRGEQAANQEKRFGRYRPGLPPLRAEGGGDFL